mmetsp:Transcript_53351/g.141872  ORF Transcript_53351/g.141872 Transcript_53351/m.141872 type:complete len:544 (+) Transcript_53351:311-1942(+)
MDLRGRALHLQPLRRCRRRQLHQDQGAGAGLGPALGGAARVGLDDDTLRQSHATPHVQAGGRARAIPVAARALRPLRVARDEPDHHQRAADGDGPLRARRREGGVRRGEPAVDEDRQLHLLGHLRGGDVRQARRVPHQLLSAGVEPLRLLPRALLAARRRHRARRLQLDLLQPHHPARAARLPHRPSAAPHPLGDRLAPPARHARRLPAEPPQRREPAAPAPLRLRRAGRQPLRERRAHGLLRQPAGQLPHAAEGGHAALPLRHRRVVERLDARLHDLGGERTLLERRGQLRLRLGLARLLCHLHAHRRLRAAQPRHRRHPRELLRLGGRRGAAGARRRPRAVPRGVGEARPQGLRQHRLRPADGAAAAGAPASRLPDRAADGRCAADDAHRAAALPRRGAGARPRGLRQLPGAAAVPYAPCAPRAAGVGLRGERELRPELPSDALAAGPQVWAGGRLQPLDDADRRGGLDGALRVDAHAYDGARAAAARDQEARARAEGGAALDARARPVDAEVDAGGAARRAPRAGGDQGAAAAARDPRGA